MFGLFDSRRKQSFPVFWIGGIVGIGSIIMGGCFILGYPSERDTGMLAAGIFFIMMGMLLLAGSCIH